MPVIFMITLSLIISGCQPRLAEEPAVLDNHSRWEGTLNVMNTSLVLQVQVWTEYGTRQGTIIIPQQSTKVIPLNNMRFGPNGIHFEILGGSRLAVFDGSFTNESTIDGNFRQMGMDGTFQLERINGKVPEPLPYIQKEVSFQNGDITLAGTLTIPDEEGPFPALILISGSGPQNRNEEIPTVAGYKPFLMIADFLTRNGIAVLRYDDRGVGKSTGMQRGMTSFDFSTDAEAGFDYLISRPDIRKDKVGLMGHSEGSLIAAMVAARRPEVAFIISMGGSAATGYDILRLQQDRIFALEDLSDEDLSKKITEARRALNLVKTGDWEALRGHVLKEKREYFESMPEKTKAAIRDRETSVQNMAKREMSSLKTWMYFFVTYDPAEDWSRITVPVLALQGGLDTQVDATQAKTSLEAALALAGNTDVTVKVFPKANHLFQEAVSGHPNEYATLRVTFVPGFLETISDWLRLRFN